MSVLLRYRWFSLALAIIGLGFLLLIGFSAAYAGKIYPGVSVNGLHVGGLSREEALAKLDLESQKYNSQQLQVRYYETNLRIPVKALGVSYRPQAVERAVRFGREGGVAQQLSNRLRALSGRTTSYTNYHYKDERLAPFLAHIDEDVTRPVANASLTFINGAVGIDPSHPGYRVDVGRLTASINRRLEVMSSDPVVAPVYTVTPTIDNAALQSARHQADTYATSALALKTGNLTSIIDQSKILSWIDVTTPAGRTDLPIDPINQFYDAFVGPEVHLTLSRSKVAAYVSEFAAKIDKTPQNAVLTMQNDKLTIAQPSQDGVSLDQVQSVGRVIAALGKPGTDRSVTLPGKVTPAEVNERNLDSLGIKERISQGQTFFPGSPSTRLTNVRVGQALYNGILLKPDEVFSFGKILGDVGPAQGYVPELVILADRTEKQYGGGLCQVSSTAYRAALLAGLPILQRVNHSFAVSYYTAPYGVPGIDATIYYPQVDFKFKNDTGHYILMQTHMQGTTLTFDFFGTKTKTGEIRGPSFISGSGDPKQASHTVFYRDIKDLSGTVIKTDTVHTFYKPSTDFPIEKQFN